MTNLGSILKSRDITLPTKVCCTLAFSSCSEWGLFFLAGHEHLIVVASLIAECRLQAHVLQQSHHVGSQAGMCGPSCSRAQQLAVRRFSYPSACVIFPDQGSKPSPLHWQVDDYPLHHQESPQIKLLNYDTLIYFIFVHSHMEKNYSSVFQFSHSGGVQLCHPQTAAHEAFLSINPRSLLKLMSIESVIPSNHIILCCPLLFLPSIFPSIRVFSNESVLRIKWPKCWSFSFNISPSNKYLGLISFRIHWFISLLSKGLSSLPTPQFRSTNSSALSFLYGPTLTSIHNQFGKTIALTIQTFISKTMFLLFNILSRLVIAFFPRSKHLLISWLQSPSAVII